MESAAGPSTRAPNTSDDPSTSYDGSEVSPDHVPSPPATAPRLNESGSATDEEDTDTDELHQLLKSFQAQLELQQKQLDILRRLADSKHAPGDAIHQIAPSITSNDADDEATTFRPSYNIPPGYHHSDLLEQSIDLQRKKGPVSPELARLGKEFFEDCENKKLWWFSAEASNLLTAPLLGLPPSLSPTQSRRLVEKLQRMWPQNLGSVTESEIIWKFGNSVEFGSPLDFVQYTYRGDSGNLLQVYAEPAESPIRELIHLSHPFNNTAPSPGRYILIPASSKKPSLSLELVGFVLLQLIPPALSRSDCRKPENYWTKVREDSEEKARQFIFSYLLDWEMVIDRPFTTAKAMIGGESECLFATNHIRYFDVSIRMLKHYSLSASDIPLSREVASFLDGDGASSCWLHESRSSVAVVSQSRFPFPFFSVIQLADSKESTYELLSDIRVDEFVGITLFLEVLMLSIDEACNAWVRVFNKLDKEVSVRIADLSDEEASRRLMFDDKTFSRSKLYFKVQQLCRVFSRIIDETIRDLHNHHDSFINYWKLHYWNEKQRDAIADLSLKWTNLLEARELKLKALLDRINRKKEEVESLRDGLFNATSVREASKSTDMSEISIRQNQYIFIFTVATVFYLPLGFVTSVFGMHLYDTTDPGVVRARPKFWITIVVISVATWATAGLGYWVVRKGRTENLKSLFKMKRDSKEHAEEEIKIERMQEPRSGIFRRRKDKVRGKEKASDV